MDRPETRPLKNVESLHSLSQKDLAQLAKTRGVQGWHAMRKDQLIRALARKAKVSKPRTVTASRRATKPAASGKPALAKRRHKPRAVSRVLRRPAQNGEVSARLSAVRVQRDRNKNLATTKDHRKGPLKERLVLMVRDAYWLHAYWELSRLSVERAQSALGQEWHTARPVLRLYEVSSGKTTSSAEAFLRDIEVHGGVNNWYIDVQDPPKSYRLDIGYRSTSGRFFTLARSTVVTTPKADSSDAIDENWQEVAENYEKIYALSGGSSPEGPSVELQELFEERLRRPMGAPVISQYAKGVTSMLSGKRDFSFQLDAELIVYGVTEPDAHVTLQGDPVKLRPDGTFTVRFSLPNCRQVIPAVATSRDGIEQRTIVLAVERNTKTMEPLIRDGNE